VSPGRVAVIKMSALGDIAKSIPAVRAIRETHPTCAMAWLVRPVWADLLVGNPDIDRIIPVGRSLRGLIWAMVALRRFRPETVLDMQGLFASGLLSLASGATTRFTWASGRELSGLLTGNPVVPGPTRLNVAECNFGFARLLGATRLPQDPPAYLAADGPARLRVREALGGLARPLVGMHVGASEPNKRWPVERWSAVASALRAAGCGVVLLGGPGDRAAAEDVAARSDGCGVMAGRTTLRELAALVCECAAYIGGDSGATHVAALMGVPTVCLMGPTLPGHSGPFGPGHRILYLGLPCSPCYRRPTCQGRFDCMTGITAEMVVSACREQLGAEAGSRR
jgi:ADP-heptose:LPS heptosyltransferase